jgi:hypothetical protein
MENRPLMPILFRPHHFLCALCFEGKGYSPAFIANFSRILEQLQDRPNTSIQITSHTDSICAPCPHRSGTTCASETKINRLDQAHAAALRMETTSALTWEEAKNRIKSHLTLETFHHICDSCEWKSLGICEKVLTDFLSD